MDDGESIQRPNEGRLFETPNGFIDYLDLDGYRTLKVEQVESMIAVRAAYCVTPEACPQCSAVHIEVEKCDDWLVWDAPRFGILPTLIQVLVPIFRCLVCGARFELQPPWLDYSSAAAENDKRPPRPTRTSRLVAYIMDRMTTVTTFAQIARDTGYSEDAIRAVFATHFKAWDAERGKDLPLSFEMDETLHKYGKGGGLVTLMVGEEDGHTVDVLPDRENSTIARRFFEADNRGEVERVGMDYSEQFRHVATKPLKPQKSKPAEEVVPELLEGVEMVDYVVDDSGESPESTRALPKAKAGGENFHLSQAFEEALTDVRTFVANSLPQKYLSEELAKASPEDIAKMGEAAFRARAKIRADQRASERVSDLKRRRLWLAPRAKDLAPGQTLWVEDVLAEFPLIKAAYELKNEGLEITSKKRNRKTGEQVRAGIEHWLVSWKQSIAGSFFSRPKNILTKWTEELVRSAEAGINTNKIESKNGLFKLRNRMGRGVSIETIRAWIVWADSRRRMNRWPKSCGDVKTARQFIEFLDSRAQKE
jgi:transposase